MVRKKVDERIRTLMENNVKTNHRSLFVIIGDGGKDQVVNLHYLLSKLQIKARPSVLWCYKKELGFSTHKKKRMKQIKKMVQRGLYDPEKDDPFELFVASTNIRWAYYKDSDKILGQTFGMCVLQDFEALTPNLLARTVETVEGGGIVVLLLKNLDSLKQLYSMTMDCHTRFRTEAHSIVKPRFNERFMLTLGMCESCVVVDHELNILPISKHIRHIKPLERVEGEDFEGDHNKKLKELKESLAGTQPACNLVGLSKTLDQARALMNFIDAVSEKSLAATVTLTAGRGRGKSAALGIAIASAVAFGYSNIFVTSPSPENLKTVFEFVFKGLDAIEYKEHMDYEIIQSTNPDYNKAVVRVNIFHQHRQTIQYIEPQDSAKLSQAELVVIDEAAAIPLPLVKDLLGPYLVFMSSTINGYEGTGRSLSLKLINQLRQTSAPSAKGSDWRTNEFMFAKKARGTEETSEIIKKTAVSMTTSKRTLREIELKQPIRYNDNDPVEKWLNHTLCLDATSVEQHLTKGTPHPSSCSLFAVDRDTLFSHHAVSEAMLQRIVSLFVASHYKNSPNDLQLLSDAPAHRLFVLLGPQAEHQDDDDDANDEEDTLPDILCVIQVALEGGISRKIVEHNLRHGNRASGDLVPWTISQQFQDNEFAKLDGARVVRIATHPGATRMGYGKRALELLTRFYQGELINADNNEDDDATARFENLGEAVIKSDKGLLNEKVKPRKDLPPLMVPLDDLRPPRLHYISVSYGLTKDLFSFWSNAGYRPVYLRQTANDLTGEYTCIMVQPLDCSDLLNAPAQGWLDAFTLDFARRFQSLLAGPFKDISATLGLSILNCAINSDTGKMSQDEIDAGQEGEKKNGEAENGKQENVISAKALEMYFSAHDIKRLEAYSKNLVDFHLVTDLLHRLASLFFERKLPDSFSLSLLQRALLVAMGMQYKTVECLSKEYELPVSQLLALFNKAMRKLTNCLIKIQQQGASDELNEEIPMKSAKKVKDKLKQPVGKSMDAEQDMEGQKAIKNMKKRQKEMLEALDLEQFTIQGDDAAWNDATSKGVSDMGLVSIKKKSGGDDQQKARKKRLQEAKFANRSGKHKRSRK